MKQPIKKKEFKKPNFEDFKKEFGFNIVKSAEDLTQSVAEKPTSFIPLPEAFADAVKIVGIPEGYLSVVTGWANTGKSTIKNCLIASCINNGIIPVIYETENNFDFKYAIDCGMKATPVYGEVEVEHVDEETGEITVVKENRIINYTGDFIYFDSTLLAERYGDIDHSNGTRGKKKRKVAVIEDIAYSINELLDYQDEGKIQQPLCFIWDSVGSLGSYKSYTSKVGNNMFDALAISQAFSTIINNRIPSSRRVDSPYTNTFFCVNKIWNDSMNAMPGAGASIELKNGKTITYGARLILHVGGVTKAATKKLEAQAKGEKYQYGIITKCTVRKNQLPTPYNITYSNEIACVHNGLLNPEKLDEYKKEYLGDILKKLEDLNNGKKIDASDISFEEEEDDD